MGKILIYGYGNPGRQDDGLGVLLAQKVELWAIENNVQEICVDTNYQLNIEDAYELNKFDKVFFLDASVENIEQFKIHPLKPVINPSFTMHAVSPEFIVGLCQEIYGEYPDSFLMHIKGFEWGFMKEITDQANKNLDAAFHYLCSEELLLKPSV